MKHLTRLILLATGLLVASHVVAQSIAVTNPWVRATVQGQKATGAFMTVTSKENAKLVAVSSPVASVVEIHEMKMDKDVMKMAALANGLDLPAGQAVDLKPGGYHIMFIDLKAPLKEGDHIKARLVFEHAGTVDVEFDVGGIGQTTPPHGHDMPM